MEEDILNYLPTVMFQKSFSYFDDFSSFVIFQFRLVQCCYINGEPVFRFMFFNGTKNRMDSEKKNTSMYGHLWSARC